MRLREHHLRWTLAWFCRGLADGRARLFHVLADTPQWLDADAEAERAATDRLDAGFRAGMLAARRMFAKQLDGDPRCQPFGLTRVARQRMRYKSTAAQQLQFVLSSALRRSAVVGASPHWPTGGRCSLNSRAFGSMSLADFCRGFVDGHARLRDVLAETPRWQDADAEAERAVTERLDAGFESVQACAPHGGCSLSGWMQTPGAQLRSC